MTAANVNAVLVRALAFVKQNWIELLLGAATWIVERQWGDGSLRPSDVIYAAFVGGCFTLGAEITRRNCSPRPDA